MTTHPWTEDPLRQFVLDVWSGPLSLLQRELHCSRQTFETLLDGNHAKEPRGLIEQLHLKLAPQLRKLGFGVKVEDVCAMWRRSAAE